jgi:hypothetical protein
MIRVMFGWGILVACLSIIIYFFVMLGLGLGTGKDGGRSYDSGFLVDFPGAKMAVSVRRLRESYKGPAMTLQNNNSGSIILDLYYDENGDLDTSQVASTFGGQTAYIKVWYDQSGNNINLVQPEVTRAPMLYDGSVVQTLNGKPAVKFDGTEWLPNGFSLGEPYTGNVKTATLVSSYDGPNNNFRNMLGFRRSDNSVATMKSMTWPNEVFFAPANYILSNNIQAVNGASATVSTGQQSIVLWGGVVLSI